MPGLTLSAALARYRAAVFAPVRATDPRFIPSADRVREVDTAFYQALGSHLSNLTHGKRAQFVMLHVCGDIPRIEALLRETTSDVDALLKATLAALQ